MRWNEIVESEIVEAKTKFKVGDHVNVRDDYGDTVVGRIEGPAGPGEFYVRTAHDRSHIAKAADLELRKAPELRPNIVAMLEKKTGYAKAWDLAVAIGQAVSMIEHDYPDNFDAVEWEDLARELFSEIEGRAVSMAWLLVQAIEYEGINDEWAKSVMAKYKGVQEDNDVVPAVRKPVATLTGPHRDGLTLEQAAKYLQQYPDGALHHDVFERENFVYLTRQGDWRYFDAAANKAEAWDWKTDIEALVKYADSYDMQSGWWYEPYDWKSELTGDADWFEKLLDGGQ